MNHFPSHYPDIGVLGEELVAEWLQSTGWIILHRRWRCRWGEIDIIAQHKEFRSSKGENSVTSVTPITSALPLLAFVEVKTRSRGNWDAGGILSITPRKQAKLWQTAQCFLGTYPKYVDYPCRFDVALVYCQRLSTSKYNSANSSSLPGLAQAIANPCYQLILQEYIPSAFERD